MIVTKVKRFFLNIFTTHTIAHITTHTTTHTTTYFIAEIKAES